MKTIDVEGLPEIMIRWVESLVSRLRAQLGPAEVGKREVTLRTKRGRVVGSLRREDLYADAG